MTDHSELGFADIVSKMNEINLLFQRKQIGIVGNGRFGALKQKLEFYKISNKLL